MKKCPYCAEEIQDEAIKCRYCGEAFGKRPGDKWYFKPYWLIIAFLCIGPLAIPLVWFNPRFNRKHKMVISIIVIILSCLIGAVVVGSVKNVIGYYRQIFQLL